MTFVLALAAASAGLIVMGLEAFDSRGFLAGGLALLFEVLILPVAGAVFLVRGGFRHRRRTAAIGAGLLLTGVGAFVATAGVQRWQERVSMARGDRVCAALERYRARAGAYPESLANLVPDCLEGIPVSAMGVLRDVPFRFWRSRGEDYLLGFDSLFLKLCARGRAGSWRCDD
jgi:hypothetical protein